MENKQPKLTEAELQELAGHLRCPDGREGIKVAEMMNLTNANIINKTINSLNITAGDTILEAGPGNGSHVKHILNIAPRIVYTGIDISDTMVTEATNAYKSYSNVGFILTDGNAIPFNACTFDKIFTVNTIYFWAMPEQYSAETARVLKTGGRLALGFIPKRIMEKIPFAKYGFMMWDETAVMSLLEGAGFEVVSQYTEKELIEGSTGETISREFVIITAKKL